MKADQPPFDPPYVSTRHTETGAQYVETLADGTTRPASAARVGRMQTTETGNTNTPPSELAAMSVNSRASDARPKSPQSDNSQARIFLKVPFAEKDAAKALGAKWDATQKKWYIPHGADVGLFARWSPDALK